MRSSQVSASSHRLPNSEFWESEESQNSSKFFKALRAYRKEWDEEKGIWRDKPRHDWASDGADASAPWRHAIATSTQPRRQSRSRKKTRYCTSAQAGGSRLFSALLDLRVGRGEAQKAQESEGFIWRPLVTEANGLICALDILMLREGAPGQALQDVDNRLKTIFDALRKPKGPQELGDGTTRGRRTPDLDENPFFVLLEEDRLITHVAVTTDTFLEAVPKPTPGNAVHLVIGVTIRPYNVHMENLAFT